MRKPKYPDIVGQTFNNWKVIENYNNSQTYCLCVCKCGTKRTLRRKQLIEGLSKSCGCLKMENKQKELVGQKFGRLEVVSLSSRKSPYRFRYWICFCDCGKAVEVQTSQLTSGRTKSCGCLTKEVVANLNTTHGYSKTTKYSSWQHMKDRCYNLNNENFNDYGGRGIKVCDRWLESFENFLEDIGTKPSLKHSLDRIDNNGDYEPSNCKWSTQTEQMNNTRRNNIITYKGQSLTLSEWAGLLKITRTALHNRFKKGWSTKKCLETPKKLI